MGDGIAWQPPPFPTEPWVGLVRCLRYASVVKTDLRRNDP